MITIGDIKRACSKLNDDTPVVIVVKSGKHLMQPEISTIKILPKEDFYLNLTTLRLSCDITGAHEMSGGTKEPGKVL